VDTDIDVVFDPCDPLVLIPAAVVAVTVSEPVPVIVIWQSISVAEMNL